MAKSNIYYEPENYFPKDIRKEFGLGEFNKEAQEEAKRLEKEQKEVNNRIRDFVNDK